MLRRRSSWLVGALVCALLAAGCGGSSSTSSHSGKQGTPATSTAATSSTSTTAPSAAKVAQAIAACKAQIKAQSTLPARAKARLESICGEVAKGDTKAVTTVAREVCEEVINGASLPAGASREQALAACKAK